MAWQGWPSSSSSSATSRRQRRPVAVQALEDDGRAVVEQRQRLARVDQAGERLAGQRRAAGVRRLRQHRAVPGQPDRRACGSRWRSAGGRRRRGRAGRPARRVGAVQVHPGRPDLREEGLGVTAEQVESDTQEASPSVRRVGGVAVGAVAVGAVGVGRRRRRCRRCRCRRVPSRVGAVAVASPSVPSASPPEPSPPAAGRPVVMSSSLRGSSGASWVLLGRVRRRCQSFGAGGDGQEARCTSGQSVPRRAPARVTRQSSSPRRRAIAAASVRPEASSLPRMLETWTLTVLALMNSCLPISPLRPALRDQRQDLALARGERVGRRRRCGPASDAERAELVEQGLGTQPAGGLPGRGRRPRGPRPGRRWRAGSRPARPATGRSRDVAEVLEHHDRLAPDVDQHVGRRGVDAAQPAHPQQLGVEPLDPGPPLGPPEAGRVGVPLQHRVPVAVEPLGDLDVRRPLGRGHRRDGAGDGPERDGGQPDPGAEPRVPDLRHLLRRPTS